MTMNEKDVEWIERFRRLVVRLLFQLGWLMILSAGITLSYSIYSGEHIDVLTERIQRLVEFIWSIDYELFILILMGCYIIQSYRYIVDYMKGNDYIDEEVD